MLFNSYVFMLAFLPLTLLGYFLLGRLPEKNQLNKVFLVLASFLFYGYNNPGYVPIIAGSILVNYALSQLMLTREKKAVRLPLMLLGLFLNLGVLFYFKYHDFFFENLNGAFGLHLTLNRLALPLGISFFTFQQLSYVIDSYKRTVPRYNILDYALFVTFFPQLIAGPIVLHSEIVPQFADAQNRHFNFDNFAPGLYAFARGLMKKVVIADTFAVAVEAGFASAQTLNTAEAWFVAIGYTLQLYFDFSGYCDMATGVGLMFNIKIPINFNSPYKSLNIREFWQRWHITLSRFLTTYIYFPLGGSRKGMARTCVNLMIVFLLSGLWHGAGWLFLLWGLMHGAASVLYRQFQLHRRGVGLLPRDEPDRRAGHRQIHADDELWAAARFHHVGLRPARRFPRGLQRHLHDDLVRRVAVRLPGSAQHLRKDDGFPSDAVQRPDHGADDRLLHPVALQRERVPVFQFLTDSPAVQRT